MLPHNQDRLTNQLRAFELSVSFIGLDIKNFKKIIQKVIYKKKKNIWKRFNTLRDPKM